MFASRLTYIKKWDVVAMNHYHLKGKRFVFIVVSRDDGISERFYMKFEGPDEYEFWRNLDAHLAAREGEFN